MTTQRAPRLDMTPGWDTVELFREQVGLQWDKTIDGFRNPVEAYAYLCGFDIGRQRAARRDETYTNCYTPATETTKLAWAAGEDAGKASVAKSHAERLKRHDRFKP